MDLSEKPICGGINTVPFGITRFSLVLKAFLVAGREKAWPFLAKMKLASFGVFECHQVTVKPRVWEQCSQMSAGKHAKCRIGPTLLTYKDPLSTTPLFPKLRSVGHLKSGVFVCCLHSFAFLCFDTNSLFPVHPLLGFGDFVG